MTLDEEFKIINVMLEICEEVYKSKNKFTSYEQVILNLNNDNFIISPLNDDFYFYIKNSNDDSKSNLIFKFTIDNFINHRAINKWTLAFNKDYTNYNTYSLINIRDFEIEQYVDSYTKDGKIFNESEHFQLSLICNELPDYDICIKCINFMKDKQKNFNGLPDKSFSATLGLMNLELINNIKVLVLEELGKMKYEYC